jgi:hypothetical protein
MIATATTNPPRMNGYQFMGAPLQNPNDEEDKQDEQEQAAADEHLVRSFRALARVRQPRRRPRGGDVAFEFRPLVRMHPRYEAEAFNRLDQRLDRPPHSRLERSGGT